MYNFELFLNLLHEIVTCIDEECNKISVGGYSEWDYSILRNIVLPEISELLVYARRGIVYFKYGKAHRQLQATYLLTDSLLPLNKTTLGFKISELQKIYNSL